MHHSPTRSLSTTEREGLRDADPRFISSRHLNACADGEAKVVTAIDKGSRRIRGNDPGELLTAGRVHPVSVTELLGVKPVPEIVPSASSGVFWTREMSGGSPVPSSTLLAYSFHKGAELVGPATLDDAATLASKNHEAYLPGGHFSRTGGYARRPMPSPVAPPPLSRPTARWASRRSGK